MIKDFYGQIAHKELTLRDRLALERTALANERTLLAYVRTMVGLMAVGGTLLKFFSDWWLVLTGWTFLAFGLILLVVGFARYLRMYTLMYSLEQTEMEQLLKRDRVQYLIWNTLQKMHLVKLKV